MNTKKLKICQYIQILVIRKKQYTSNNLNILGRDNAAAKPNYCGPKIQNIGVAIEITCIS